MSAKLNCSYAVTHHSVGKLVKVLHSYIPQ